jgi:phage virion morphogenesis protein
VTARVVIADGLVRRAFQGLEALGADLTPLFREVGSRLVSNTKLRFEEGRAPDGRAWIPSIRARTQRGQTLRSSGNLMNSISYRAEPRQVIVGTNTPYAAVHQFGTTIRAKNAKALRFQIGERWVFKKSVTIPARPFLGISAEDVVDLQAIVARRVAQAIAGRGP